MRLIANILTALIALIHLAIMTIEMFFWDHPIGRGIFDTTEAFASETAFMASNQGLYNGFLVAGLVWGLLAKKRDVSIFFLLCVLVAGVFGALTVSPTIFVVQSIPAIFALGFTLAAKR